MIITDLYQTKITVYSNSNYSTVSNNINIDGTAYIKVKLIDFNGAAVSGKSVTIKYDESTVVATGTTNSNGEFTASYTCTEWGIHSFSANNTNIQVSVTGWRTVVNDSSYLIKYNDKLVSATIKSAASTSYSTTYAEFGVDILKDGDVDLRPLRPMSVIQSNGNIVMIKDNSYRFGKFRISGTGTGEAHAHFTYERR